MTEIEPERIWLIYDKEADEPVTWSSTPNPYEPFGEVPETAVEYVRADKLEALSGRVRELEKQRLMILAAVYKEAPRFVATICDESLDRSGALLGEVRELASAALAQTQSEGA